ncbi:hypothetical protein NODU109028_04525 [Nocardioides dubius]|uniref:PIN domain-containing protein n=1 Tax=Nocardioides dubius TaxID=317019 RepID=A0ABN1TPK0_9ACTN
MNVRPHAILLDAEGLSALAAGERRMQAWAEVALRSSSILYASTATLAEVARGTAANANLRRTAKAVRLVQVDESIGYRAGALRARAASRRRKPRDLTVNAIVAATAIDLPRPTIVLTSDAPDLATLLAGHAVQVESI